ncbi:MAG: hypothetical protein WBB19_15175 [Desulforhopalus sp.]
MTDLLFLFGLGFVLARLLGWGFKHLPAERWLFEVSAVLLPIGKLDQQVSCTNWLLSVLSMQRPLATQKS